MKKLFLFVLVAFAVSCSKEAADEPQTPDQPSAQPEMVTVSFAMQGDVTIEEDPLSRAPGEETESTDLYGINIYYNEERDSVINDVYGYGLFDNVADMTVSLLTGYKYKFVCSLVKDGKNKILNGFAYGMDETSSYSDYMGYGAPFWKSMQYYKENAYDYDYQGYSYYSSFYHYCYKDAPTILENKFVLGTGYHLTGLGQGVYHEKSADNINCYSSNYTYYSPCDRYYGETTDYTPKEGGVVNINLKRCVFGVKVVVTGVTDGTFTFNVGPISKSGITSDTTYEGEIFTHHNVYACWQKAMAGEEFSEDSYLFMTWERGNGVTQEFDTQKVTFKRNILTTVNIRLNGGKTDNTFNLDVESTEMGEANTDFDVDAGDITDTPVEPTE